MPRTLSLFVGCAWVLAVLVILGSGTAWAETWYVKSSPTPITADPSSRSRTLGNLNAGQAVEVIAESGRYYKISVGGQEGYVYKFKLTQTPPAGGAVQSRSSNASSGSSNASSDSSTTNSRSRTSSSRSTGGGGGGGLDALLGNQKMAAAESSSASSIRGLNPISEQYGKGQGISQETINAVNQMEGFTVSPNEVNRFQQEGGLGRYSK